MKKILSLILILVLASLVPGRGAASGSRSVDRWPSLSTGSSFAPAPAFGEAASFEDVPPDHPYFAYIEALYRGGYTAGCSLDPPLYCPEKELDREEAAVFLERGLHGADFVPPVPTQQIFADLPLSRWSVEWGTALWEDALTAGCGTEPLIFCPDRGQSRAEVSVFALRIFLGANYQPPDPTGIFGDVPLTAWYADWVEAAYHEGLITACEGTPELRFCPEALVSRGAMAEILVKALKLALAEPPPSVEVIPTFHSLGIYWTPLEAGAEVAAEVRYRPFGLGAWKQGMPLWFDERDGQYRGSLVNLVPGARYEIQLALAGTQRVETFGVETWSEDFPIGETIYLPEHSTETLVIDRAGKPEGYLLFTHAPGKSALIDLQYEADANVRITGKAAYVIVRGLTLRGSRRHGIEFTGGAHDIVLEGNDISAWGTNGPEGWGQGKQSAIYAGDHAKVERVVVQRNRLHHPRSDTNSWAEYRQDKGTYHPGGPQAVTFVNSKGSHVIRYNAVYSDFDHYFNDPIGAGSNFSFEGFPNRDSDIYGNYICCAWDDGIESEGANMNVRIWGNYIEDTFVKIAIAGTSRGPLYIWRNVAGASRRSAIEPDPDQYGRSHFLKAGGETRGGTWYGSGRTYVFHNTVLQPDPPQGASYPLGGAGGIVGSGGDLYELISRNNLFAHYKGGTTFRDNVDSCTNDWDYDVYHGRIKDDCASRPHERHGHSFDGETWWRYLDPSQPAFVFDPISGTATGSFGLDPSHAAGALGIDAGVILPGFNDAHLGAGPDVGAFEVGAPPMEFGVGAYR